MPVTNTQFNLRSRAARLGGALLCFLALTSGCPPSNLAEQDDMTDMGIDPGLDPRTLFEMSVKPQITPTCQACHQTRQDTVDPFLVPGMEYASITGYGNGKFLTQNPDMSVLLLKGKHIGPALTDAQYKAVRAWLASEAQARGNGMRSAATPTVAVRTGDFFISLSSLVMDPLAKITFQMTQVSSSVYHIVNLQLTAGPTATVHIKHPRFVIFTANGAFPDAGDSLSTVDSMYAPSMTGNIGTGSLLLTSVPPTNARIALAFDTIELVNPTMVMLQCKAFNLFSPNVSNALAGCAVQCHSFSGSDPSRSQQATGAFNMTAARGSDQTALQQLCINALGRIVPSDPPRSVLIRQPEPYDPNKPTDPYNGTPNHPYKILDATTFMNFKMTLSTWAAAEK